MLSFVEVIPILLSVPGVISVLSKRFCQDPLESFFGKQRYKGGRNEKPSVKEFLDNTVSLHTCARISCSGTPQGKLFEEET